MEARLNHAVFTRLANAQAVLLPGGNVVQGIFDNGYQQDQVGRSGMASAAPSFNLPTSDVPANPVGTQLVCRGVSYNIVEHQSDGTGSSVLHLERSA